MIGGVIVSHGKLAEELLNALTIILGEAVNIEAISIGWYDDVEESKKKIDQGKPYSHQNKREAKSHS